MQQCLETCSDRNLQTSFLFHSAFTWCKNMWSRLDLKHCHYIFKHKQGGISVLIFFSFFVRCTVSTTRQSAYRRLKEKRNALTSKRLTKMEYSLSCARHVFCFVTAVSLRTPPPPYLCPTSNQNAGADKHAHIYASVHFSNIVRAESAFNVLITCIVSRTLIVWTRNRLTGLTQQVHCVCVCVWGG